MVPYPAAHFCWHIRWIVINRNSQKRHWVVLLKISFTKSIVTTVFTMKRDYCSAPNLKIYKKKQGLNTFKNGQMKSEGTKNDEFVIIFWTKVLTVMPATGNQGGHSPPPPHPIFGRLVNPIPTGKGRLSPLGFFIFRHHCLCGGVQTL